MQDWCRLNNGAMLAAFTTERFTPERPCAHTHAVLEVVFLMSAGMFKDFPKRALAKRWCLSRRQVDDVVNEAQRWVDSLPRVDENSDRARSGPPHARRAIRKAGHEALVSTDTCERQRATSEPVSSQIRATSAPEASHLARARGDVFSSSPRSSSGERERERERDGEVEEDHDDAPTLQQGSKSEPEPADGDIPMSVVPAQDRPRVEAAREAIADCLRIGHGTQKPLPIRRPVEFLAASAAACPAVDLAVEIRKADLWAVRSGAKGWKQDWKRFLGGWFGRAQDSGGSSPEKIGEGARHPEPSRNSGSSENRTGGTQRVRDEDYYARALRGEV